MFARIKANPGQTQAGLPDHGLGTRLPLRTIHITPGPQQRGKKCRGRPCVYPGFFTPQMLSSLNVIILWEYVAVKETVFVGKSPQSQRLRRLLERFARSRSPILLVGETGTGKDRAARWLHEASGCSGAFVVIDARESESLLHAQLRGYAEGAFTGSHGAKAGCLERARGGTIYLDGIDSFSLQSQKVILALLSRGAVRRLGESRSRPINARIMASSQRDLLPLIQKGQFRFDLYQRIAVLQLQLPSLRSRPQDLLALVKHFLGPRKISKSAFKALIRCPWKGNVRQLKQVLEVAKVMQDEETLKGSTLEPLLSDKDEWVRDSKNAYQSLRQRAFSEEQQFLQGILARHHGCISKTARALGLSRQQLSRRLTKLKHLQSKPPQR